MKSLAILLLSCSTLVSGVALAGVRDRELVANDGFPGLSLRIDDESAPAGSITQVKLGITEPKPISTGKGKVKTAGLTTINGIALMNRDQDAVGIAEVRDGEIAFTITSPSGQFGTVADYPILGIAGTVAGGAAVGTTFPLTIDAGALTFAGPGVATYPYEITNGTLTVNRGVSIGNVVPGSSTVPAGGVVTISGTNFTPDTRLQLNEIKIAQTRYVSPTQIDVVLAQSANMHGVRIRAKNPDGSEATYFSYQRTSAASPSSDAMLQNVVPLFAAQQRSTFVIPVTVSRSGGRRRPIGVGTSSNGVSASAAAIALQNLDSATVTARVELLDASGGVIAVSDVAVPSNRYLLRELSEVFGPVSRVASIRVSGSSPLQAMGLTIDRSAARLTPISPH